MRIANSVMLVVFLSCIAVQYNDPDPIRWVAYYAVASLFALLAIAKIYTGFAAVAALAFFGGFAYYTPGWGLDTLELLSEPKMSSKEVELAREAIGLLICAVWMSVLAYVWYRRRAQESGDGAPEEDAAKAE